MWKYLATALLLSAIFSTLARGEESVNVTPCQCALQGINLLNKPWSMEVLGNGLEDFMFDLDGDGWADLELLVPQGDANRIPLFYWFNDPDSKARYTLKDGKRDGTCTGMAVIWHKYKPNWRKGA